MARNSVHLKVNNCIFWGPILELCIWQSSLFLWCIHVDISMHDLFIARIKWNWIMQLAYFIIPAPQHRFTLVWEKENDVRNLWANYCSYAAGFVACMSSFSLLYCSFIGNWCCLEFFFHTGIFEKCTVNLCQAECWNKICTRDEWNFGTALLCISEWSGW